MKLALANSCRRLNRFAAVAVVLLAGVAVSVARAQDAESTQPGDPLDAIESRLADRYDRLELLAGRLAELSGSAQPRRAELLRQLIARGRERDVPGQFDDIVAALGNESYSTAVEGQTRLQAELEKLLELLLQEDRDRQLESERKRVLRYLQDLNKLIRLQRGVTARTEGGDEAGQLADDQERVGDDTEKLEQEIKEHEATENDAAPKDGAKPSAGSQSPQSGGKQPSESKPTEGEPEQEGEHSGDPQKNEQESGEQQSGEQQSGEQQSGEQQSGEQQQGGQQSGSPSPPSQDGQSDSQQPQQQSPMQHAAESLKQAQQRMQEAKKQLEEAQRDGAMAEQRRALEQLEQAKADLERILRQLREEEMERMLVLLEARFRRMLDEQVAVYEETKKLDAAAANVPEHELEIASGRLSRREKLIVREADRALVLLREDGTSVAFPEAIEQARDDMQQIAERLNRVKTDMITQGMEEDVIAALEETLAALQQALENLRDQKAQQQQGGGPPGEQPLVDQLAELRMIRALQVRVNRRTEQFGAMIQGEQALENELLGMLDELALRQSKVFQATRDLETKANQ